MGKNEINKIKVKKLKIIKLPAGDVLRFLRKKNKSSLIGHIE